MTTRTIHDVSHDTLNEFANLDGYAFRILDGGRLMYEPSVYVPEVFHDDDKDIEVLSDDWEALQGYTGQYGYRGAVMHPSEYLGGNLAKDILNDPGLYAVVIVSVYDDEEPGEVAGWTVLRHK